MAKKSVKINPLTREHPILTVMVPCYNSAEYMERCIKTLLPERERIEILLVDDGSTDATASIADAYEIKYPGIVKAIHKTNGGHGDAINSGLANAHGEYFKVVDSDDWFDEKAFHEILDQLIKFYKEGTGLDMMISNFVYYKLGAKHHQVMRYKNAFPKGRVFGWNDKIHLKNYQYVLMHSIIYRTQILRDCNLRLPKHTFYVDNIYMYQPLPLVKKMYYMDVNLYQYLIGRDDQSVNERTMIKRIDQQIRVNKLMMDIYSKCRNLPENLDQYMVHYFNMMMTVASEMLMLGGEKIHLEKKQELWNYLKREYPALYRKIKYTFLGMGMNLPGPMGRHIAIIGYRICQKIFGFN